MANDGGSARRWRRAVALLVVFGLMASACSDDADEPTADSPAGDEPTTDGPDRTDEPKTLSITRGPLSIRLSAGEALTAEAETNPVVAGTALDNDEVAAILDRLGDWAVDPSDPSDFERPTESLRPPLTGLTIDEPFPVVGDNPSPAVDPGPVEVLRFSPEGDVALAPDISITFNQPMVPLGTVGQMAALDVPIVVTPDLPGQWEWIGTRTIRFEHDSELFDRLPMATEYKVEIPAGTTSAAGNTSLRAKLNWNRAATDKIHNAMFALSRNWPEW